MDATTQADGGFVMAGPRERNAAAAFDEARCLQAGMARRGLAAIIDVVVVVATLYALEAGVALSMIGAWRGSLDHGSTAVVGDCAVSVVVAVAYSAECWSRSGRTAGGAVLGLRVLGRDGFPLRPGEAILRAVGCVVFPIGVLWAAVDGQRRSLQDIAVHSRVVRERVPSS